MAKNKISEWSSTPANNTDVGGIDIAEGCAPSGINNAIREMMAQVKDMQAGTDGDDFTVGGDLIVTGTTTFSGGLGADLPIADGGTGASTAADARTNLGLGTIATQAASSVTITGGSITGITDLTVADGGTGASSITANSVILGNGTNTLSGNLVAPSTSGNVLMSNGTTWESVANNKLTSATSQSASGASVNFGSIPSWAKRITVNFSQVSSSSTNALEVRLGTSSGIISSGYLSVSSTSGGDASSTTGFILRLTSASDYVSGQVIITNLSGNLWVSSHAMGKSGAGIYGGGTVDIGATLTQLSIFPTSGTLDGGSLNIMYE